MTGKRLLDVTASGAGLLVLSPLLLLIALAIRLDSPGPVFFRQERVGRDGRPFRIYKYRTMRVDAEKLGAPITVGRDPRITRVGHWLRKSKLDELPQLLNVLKGEMSLVGPRPEVPKYVALYTPEQRRVLSIKPGITDLASIAFRDENDLLAGQTDPERFYVEEIMPRKLELNLEYLERASVGYDLWLIARTFWRIAFPERPHRRSSTPAGYASKRR